MSNLPSSSVQLVVTDPPYNVGYMYAGYCDNLPRDDYLERLRFVFRECHRVLNGSGTMIVVQGDHYAAETKLLLDNAGFIFRQWCVWYYTFGVQCSRMFARSHVHVLYYTKSRAFTFNADAVRVPSDRQTKYGDTRANPAGKLPDDVMTFSRVCGTFKERRGTPNQLPESLVERFILACSNPGDTVLDPYCGSGTVPAVAKRLGRQFIGIELVPEYANIAKERVS